MELEDDAEEIQDATSILINLISLKQPDQPTTVNQPLEVVVTDQQCTMTFNGEQSAYCVRKLYFQIQMKIKLKIVTKCVKLKTVFYTF